MQDNPRIANLSEDEWFVADARGASTDAPRSAANLATREIEGDQAPRGIDVDACLLVAEQRKGCSAVCNSALERHIAHLQDGCWSCIE